MTARRFRHLLLMAAMPAATARRRIIRRIRHFPVVLNRRRCGIVSIGDVVKGHRDQTEYEVE